VVVALHFVVEDLGLAGVGARDQVFVQNAEDVAANVLQFFLDLRKEGPILGYKLQCWVTNSEVNEWCDISEIKKVISGRGFCHFSCCYTFSVYSIP
jgi:hypothetical protein